MTRYLTLLPIALWAGGLPLNAHALQAVDLIGYDATAEGVPAIASGWDAAAEAFPPLCQPSAQPAPEPAGPMLVRTAAAAESAGRTTMGAEATEAAEAGRYLAEARLPASGGGSARGGWLAQMVAGLAVIGLVARRRLGLL